MEIINHYIIENDPILKNKEMPYLFTPNLTIENLLEIIDDKKSIGVELFAIVTKEPLNDDVKDLLKSKKIIVYSNIGDNYERMIEEIGIQDKQDKRLRN